MLGTLRLILGLRLGEGVCDGAGVLIDGRDGLGVNDLLRSNDGLDGRVGTDLGLMDGLDRPGLIDGLGRPGLMDGLGRLGAIEGFGLGEVDRRVLLIRSSREPRFELSDCAMIDGLRRLEIEKPPRLFDAELRLLRIPEFDVGRLGVRLVAPELDRELKRLSASERELEAERPSTDDAISKATATKIATTAARESFLSPMTNIVMLLSPAVMLSASLTPQPAHRRYSAPETASCHMTVSLPTKGMLL